MKIPNRYRVLWIQYIVKKCAVLQKVKPLSVLAHNIPVRGKSSYICTESLRGHLHSVRLYNSKLEDGRYYGLQLS